MIILVQIFAIIDNFSKWSHTLKIRGDIRQGYHLDKVIEQIGHIVIITFCCENTIMKTYFLLNTYDNNDKKTMRI